MDEKDDKEVGLLPIDLQELARQANEFASASEDYYKLDTYDEIREKTVALFLRDSDAWIKAYRLHPNPHLKDIVLAIACKRIAICTIGITMIILTNVILVLGVWEYLGINRNPEHWFFPYSGMIITGSFASICMSWIFGILYYTFALDEFGRR